MAFKKTKINRNVGKVGWCDARVLHLSRGHFVLIRKVKNGKCEVNTFSSIEDSPGHFEWGKVDAI